MTLIETLISAVILMIVIGAVLTTIDVSSRTAANNRSRSVAATLAEEDQERMRGLSATALANFSERRDVPVDGRTYTVTSETDWVVDATGATQSCANDSTQANYIRISSTVTSPILGSRIRPVTMRSLVAPRVGSFGADQGTLGVLVTDQLNQPVRDLPVAAAGPASGTDFTNEFGCAVFSHVPVGAYTVTLDQPGWVDKDRKQVVKQAANVTQGNVTGLQLTYAPAAAIDVSFDTRVGTDPVQAARGNGITVANSSVPETGTVTFGPQAPAATIAASGLFPFPDGYTAYAGVCASNDPTTYVPDYFQSNPGFVSVFPGQTVAVTVREPAFNVQVTRGRDSAGATPEPDAHVVIASAPAECGTWELGAGSGPRLRSDATLPEPGLPFGPYTVCVDDSTVRGVTDPRKAEATIANTDPAGLPMLAGGTPQTKLFIDTDATDNRGTCA